MEKTMNETEALQRDTMKVPRLTRAVFFDRAQVNEDDRTLELSFSSELPVERWFGMEVLEHSREAVNLERLNNGAPLLFNHNMDEIVGVVEAAEIRADRRGYAKVRFAKTDDAEKVKSLVDDGIVRNVSFGYQIKEMIEQVKDKVSTFVATRWEPYEISLVTVPADPTVGVGRAADDEGCEVVITRDLTNAAAAATPNEVIEMQQDKTTEVNVDAVAAQAAEAERQRIAAIHSLGDKFSQRDLARQLVDSGRSIDEARAAFLEKIGVEQKPVTGKEADIGLSAREIKQFSFVKAINALGNPTDRSAWDAAAYEREVSEAAAKKAGKSARGIFVPGEILRAQRDLNVATATAGGNLVATELLADSFIELLRKTSVVQRAGATTMNGLVGNIAIPGQSGAATAYWVAEGNAPTESQQAIRQVAMSPKTVGAFTDFTRKLMLQSSLDVENMVRRDLATVIALEIDRAALYGVAASGQPVGVKNQSGINTKDFAAATPTFAELVGMESEVAADNADIGTMVYLVNAAMRGALKTATKFGSGTEATLWEPGNTVNGYRTEVSNQLESGDVFFGNFADLMIGFWSGLDLTVDPYAGATAGTMRVIALQDVDVAVRNAVSFCYGNAAISA
jgi:HK97 family phage major capsid protein/HK97 family phage prohead protease